MRTLLHVRVLLQGGSVLQPLHQSAGGVMMMMMMMERLLTHLHRGARAQMMVEALITDLSVCTGTVRFLTQSHNRETGDLRDDDIFILWI